MDNRPLAGLLGCWRHDTVQRAARGLALVVVMIALAPSRAHANEWMYGDVIAVEDYGSVCCAADGNPYEVLVDLKNKTWVAPSDASVCTQRFRIVTGLQG